MPSSSPTPWRRRCRRAPGAWSCSCCAPTSSTTMPRPSPSALLEAALEDAVGRRAAAGARAAGAGVRALRRAGDLASATEDARSALAMAERTGDDARWRRRRPPSSTSARSRGQPDLARMSWAVSALRRALALGRRPAACSRSSCSGRATWRRARAAMRTDGPSDAFRELYYAYDLALLECSAGDLDEAARARGAGERVGQRRGRCVRRPRCCSIRPVSSRPCRAGSATRAPSPATSWRADRRCRAASTSRWPGACSGSPRCRRATTPTRRGSSARRRASSTRSASGTPASRACCPTRSRRWRAPATSTRAAALLRAARAAGGGRRQRLGAGRGRALPRRRPARRGRRAPRCRRISRRPRPRSTPARAPSRRRACGARLGPRAAARRPAHARRDALADGARRASPRWARCSGRRARARGARARRPGPGRRASSRRRSAASPRSSRGGSRTARSARRSS